MERALSFGSVAATYERFRPGYPDQLVDTVLAYAGTPVRTALEIGAGTGTGKATRVFAARGIAVTATDPDAAMLAELRRHVPSTVTTRQASFEELPTSRAYDLVFAAASLHWTSPVGRWERVAWDGAGRDRAVHGRRPGRDRTSPAAERRRVRRPPVDDLGVPPALPRGPRARAGPDPGTCCRRTPPSTAT